MHPLIAIRALAMPLEPHRRRNARRMFIVTKKGLQTRCIHAGEAPDPSTGAHGVPMYQNVTYAFRSYEQVEAMREGRLPHFTYSPRGNPTVRSLELKIADLEGAESCAAFSAGMSAITATLLHFLRDGGHIVVGAETYDLTKDFLLHEAPRLGGSASFVDITDLAAVEAAITPETRAIYAEPASNPLLRIADIPALAALAHRHELPLVTDNTFLSPGVFRPIEHGADIVIHSATKYLSGHGQVQGGVVSGSRALIDPIRDVMVMHGGQMSPAAAWNLLNGVKTLVLRTDRHCENARLIADMLAGHPAVRMVHFPGLANHPGHEVAATLFGEPRGTWGGMMSIELHGGRAAKAAFVNAVQVATLAVSLGDVSTLIWPWHDRDLVRISVGVEDAEDLLVDLRNALDAAHTVAVP